MCPVNAEGSIQDTWKKYTRVCSKRFALTFLKKNFSNKIFRLKITKILFWNVKPSKFLTLVYCNAVFVVSRSQKSCRIWAIYFWFFDRYEVYSRKLNTSYSNSVWYERRNKQERRKLYHFVKVTLAVN